MEQGGFVLPSSHSHSEGVIDIAFSPVSRVRGLLEKKKKKLFGNSATFFNEIQNFVLLFTTVFPLATFTFVSL